ncbi:hypothetical protein [Lacticaseibacillus suilingensis]|uniref:hypothetical protein n=1 Tax=Lacticaseibacillus suilingensis TaxID=2799577 RepID=UPI0036D3E955
MTKLFKIIATDTALSVSVFWCRGLRWWAPLAGGWLCGRFEPKSGLEPKVKAAFAALNGVFNFAAIGSGKPSEKRAGLPVANRFTASHLPAPPTTATRSITVGRPASRERKREK